MFPSSLLLLICSIVLMAISSIRAFPVNPAFRFLKQSYSIKSTKVFFRQNSHEYQPSFSRIRLLSTSTTDKEIKDDVTKVDGGLKGQLKAMWTKYGYVFIGTYLGIYGLTLSSILFCLDFDVFKAASVGMDPVESVKKVSVTLKFVKP